MLFRSGGSTAERSPQIPRGRTPQVAKPQQAENRHQSDRTRSTTTQPIQFLIMKPRTPIQQEVARLSERLPKLTATQRAYAFRHCFKHYAIKRADGTNICTECGHSWKSEHDLADTVCGCTDGRSSILSSKYSTTFLESGLFLNSS